ncbi:FAD-dependent oxidoreductase [Seongchinamella sediminis]|uniref:FAD-dependent oxidoreductase n=1 Tax=Seongchinamella sediminis TaxID=2283635 RepID=A0A3L7E383_9GAMM|nr:FAD-dependent oxidoreductase [Seongchinamella sediminis]RLQ22851.1 FAD-dependent oxidoreductase [Seongchinamella sediminis]
MSAALNHLLSPGKIGPMTLRNRIVLAAMGSNFASEDGHCTEQLLAYYEARAQGGAGLLVLETSAACYPRGATMPRTLAFSDDSYLPGLRELTSRVRQHGAKIVAQLNHGGKMAQEDTAAGRLIPVPSPLTPSPSNMFKVLTRAEIGNFIKAAGPDGKGPQYQEMSEDDIAAIVNEFRDAALRAQAAGFDGVEVHAGHGYLLASFLSPYTNKRQDRYGGNHENRARLLTEIITATRAATGPDFAILVRLDAMEYRTEGGITPADCVVTASLCEAAGADAIDVSAYGNVAHAIAFTEAPLVHEPGGFIDFAKQVKAAVSVPVIGVGRIEPEVGERHIAAGDFDFLAMGRKLLADPELPNKLMARTPEQIRPCIYCYICVSQIFINKPMVCAVNHSMGREHEGDILARSGARQRVLVVGGGPGGMEAARMLAEQGHDVSLWEKEKDLGGTARIAALAYQPNERLIQYLAAEMRRLPIDLQLGKQASAEDIARFGADHVILATGAIRTAPDIPGKNQRHVFDGDELRGVLFGSDKAAAAKLSPFSRLMLWAGRLSQALRSIALMRYASRFWMPLKKEIVIIGGGLVGLELAEYLVERGRRVTVLEPGPDLGAELAIVRRARVLHMLREHGVAIHRSSPIREITSDAVVYEHEGEQQSLPARQVIIAMGAEGDSRLADALGSSEAQVHRIGDCQDIAYIDGAILSAREVVQQITA